MTHEAPSGEPLTGKAPARGGLVARGAALFTRFRSQLDNLTAFTFLQAASYLIPVVTIPYFARVLGIAGMGVLAIANAAALVAGVVMDYAIQLSGTRFAARHSADFCAINSYLDTTTALKLAIAVPTLLALGVGVALVPQMADHFWVFFWAVLSATAMALFPQWLFQGLMAMPLAARILVTCRVIAAVTALALVRAPDDIYMVPLTQAVSGMAALAVAVVMLRRRYDIRTGRQSARLTLASGRKLLADNWKLFSATAWGATYTHGAVIIMSTMLPATSIGYFSIAQKISQALISMFNVVAQTAFPTFVRMHSRAERRFSRRVGAYITVVLVAAVGVLGTMFLLRTELYSFFAGERNQTGVLIFSLWLVTSLFVIFSVSLNPMMVVLGLDGLLARVYRLTGIAFLVAAPFACAHFGAIGMTFATMTVEGAIALFFAVCVRNGLRRDPVTVG